MPIGLQLYTLGDAVVSDLEGSLRQVAQIGYREVEVHGTLGREPADIRRALRDTGLTARSLMVRFQPAGPVVGATFDEGRERVIANAREIGVRNMVLALPRIPGAQLPVTAKQVWDGMMRFTADDWKRQADELNDVGRDVARAGMRLGYHNHTPEFRDFAGKTGLDILIENTDPDLVFFEFDIGWVAKAGVDPAALIRKHAGRVGQLHLKDIKAQAPGIGVPMEPADVGAGVMNWRAVLAAAHDARVPAAFVEQEPPFDKPRIEAARIAFDYFARLRGEKVG